MSRSTATAFAPATVGNVAVGFDLLGHAIAGIGDRVTATRIADRTVRLAPIEGVETDLPIDAPLNTAGAAVLALAEALQLPFGVELRVHKGIPLGSGMGGSAASAVAAVVATEALLARPLTPEQRLQFALAGEAVASGSAHADNVAPCLLGGLVAALPGGRLVSLPTPSAVVGVVVHPHLVVHTRGARALLRPQVSLAEMTHQMGLLAGFIAGCFRDDLDLIGSTLVDTLIEPQRAHLIPGFAEVTDAALANGALGASISGAGPTVFAWAPVGLAEPIRDAMVAAFRLRGVESDGWISPLDTPGAHLVESA
jgi:homoserine kinase